MLCAFKEKSLVLVSLNLKQLWRVSVNDEVRIKRYNLCNCKKNFESLFMKLSYTKLDWTILS